MNTDKDNLFKAVVCKLLDFSYNIIFCSAANRTSGIGDNAVRTKLIATFLNFNKCTGSVWILLYLKFFKFVVTHYIRNVINVWFGVKFFNKRNNVLSVFCAEYKINTLNGKNFIRRGLSITACNGYNCIRIKFFCTTNNLTWFSVTHICYGTGVYNIHVRNFGKFFYFIAAIGK